MNWKFWQRGGQKKSTSGAQNMAVFDSLAAGLQQTGNWDLSFYVMQSYLKQCAPLADAIHRIAQKVACLPLVVRDRQNDGEIVPNHPILKLLRNPNTYQAQYDFLYQFAVTDLNLANTLPRALGNVNRPPLELKIWSPRFATLNPDRTGELGTVQIHSAYVTERYGAESVRKRTRYYDKEQTMEIWPALRYNPDEDTGRFWGLSKVRPLYYDIEQLIEAGRHNVALLANGARPSMLFTGKNEGQTPMTDDQIRRMQEHLNKYYAGAENAGRWLLGENMDAKDLSTNNKDMDYKELYLNAKSMTYQTFGIPLPKVTTQAMTMNNYATSQVAEYDEAVLPEADYLFGQLELFLMPRYGDDEGRYELTYDETQIPALRDRRIETAAKKQKIGVNTDNEIRGEMGDEPVEGGDVVFKAANQVPALGDDLDEDDDTEEIERELQNQVDSSGDAV